MTWSLVSTFDDLLTGSSRTMPSRLPKMLWPTQLMTSRLRCGEHRRQHGLHQRLAGLAVLAAVERPGRLGQLVEGGDRRAEARREVDVGVPLAERGQGVERAGRAAGSAPPSAQGGVQGVPASGATSPSGERGLGAGDVQDDQVVDPLGLDERGEVGGDPVDGLAGRSGRARPRPSRRAGRSPARRRASCRGGPGAEAAARSSRQAAISSDVEHARVRCGTPRPTRRTSPARMSWPPIDEVARLGQVEAVEERQADDQAGRGRSGRGPCAERPERDRRAHAAEGADQPETDAAGEEPGGSMRA